MVLAASAAAAPVPTPVLRVKLDSAVVGVGETLRLRVTVLVPTWFKAPPRYPSFAIANAVVRLPADSSFPVNESIAGEGWSGIVRDYEVVPLVAGRFRLPAGVLRVSFADPAGGRDRVADSPLPDIEFRAVVPVGAEDLDPYLAGVSLDLERQIDGGGVGGRGVSDDRDAEATPGIPATLGTPGTLDVGDALVVRVSARLRGMSALFLPPLTRPGGVAGVSSYIAEPLVEDGEEALRQESVTYVFDKAGRYLLPGVRLRWWNTTSGAIEETSLPDIEVAVLAGPRGGESRLFGSVRAWWLAIAAVAAGFVFYSRIGQLRRCRRRRREQWRSSEGFAFRVVLRALRAGDAAAAYRAIQVWTARVGAPVSETFTAVPSSADLLRELRLLSRAVYDERGVVDIDFTRLERLLVAARRNLESSRVERRRSALAPLNPSFAETSSAG